MQLALIWQKKKKAWWNHGKLLKWWRFQYFLNISILQNAHLNDNPSVLLLVWSSFSAKWRNGRIWPTCQRNSGRAQKSWRGTSLWHLSFLRNTSPYSRTYLNLHLKNRLEHTEAGNKSRSWVKTLLLLYPATIHTMYEDQMCKLYRRYPGNAKHCLCSS